MWISQFIKRLQEWTKGSHQIAKVRESSCCKFLYEREQVRSDIEHLLSKYEVIPVGNGFIDLILPVDRAVKLIDDLESLCVAVESATLWCHCIEDEPLAEGCPHGYGGPMNRFGPGWFSELCWGHMIDVRDHGVDIDAEVVDVPAMVHRCAEVVKSYLQEGLVREQFYTACLRPGLCLHVPDHWVRQEYDL